MYGGHSGYYQWYDYCPQCHHYNCLGNYVKGVNEISCYACSADYDGCTGLDKSEGGARAELTRYYEPKPEPVENNTTVEVVVKEKSKLEICKELVQTSEVLFA